MCADEFAPRARSRGFSLIELLVGIAVAALVGVAALSTALTLSGRQRQAITASGTSASMITALAGVKAEIAAAGLGFIIEREFRCARLNLALNGTVPVFDNAAFAPLQVERPATGFSDVLSASYATDVNGMAPVRLAADASPNDNTLLLRSWLPVGQNQLVLVAPSEGTAPCTVRSVSASVPDPGNPTAPWRLQLNDVYDFAAPAVHPANSTVSVLGTMERRTLRVNAAGQLVLDSSTLGGQVPLLDDVVAFRVQYGVVPVGGGSVSWLAPTGAWAAGATGVDLTRVRAIRLGVVTRSPQRHKQCDVNTVVPALFDESIDLSADADWNCFSYRRAEVVVPLRNTAWATA